jgi:hypothetical protein
VLAIAIEQDLIDRMRRYGWSKRYKHENDET